MNSIDFWNKIFLDKQNVYSKVEYPKEDDPVLNAALHHFGNVKNKRIIDLGCGSGKSSLYFASHGAQVISIDISSIAVNNLLEFCRLNNINNVKPMNMSALSISEIGQVEFIYGSFILHHIEPFDRFAEILRSVIIDGGKAFFHENSSESSLLIWFRQHIVGKLWLPKYGDDEEFPLMPSEIKLLKHYFNVKVVHPQLLFFRLISTYLLRGHMMAPFAFLDKIFYKIPLFRKYSYLQYLYLY